MNSVYVMVGLVSKFKLFVKLLKSVKLNRLIVRLLLIFNMIGFSSMFLVNVC